MEETLNTEAKTKSVLERGVVVHELKIHPEYFREIKACRKTAEIRIDDRDFRIGDTLVLREFKPQKKEYTGREARVEVVGLTRLSHLINNLEEDWVVMYFRVHAIVDIGSVR